MDSKPFVEAGQVVNNTGPNSDHLGIFLGMFKDVMRS